MNDGLTADCRDVNFETECGNQSLKAHSTAQRGAALPRGNVPQRVAFDEAIEFLGQIGGVVSGAL